MMNDFSCKIVAARKSKFIQISYLYTYMYKHQQWCTKKLGHKAISIHIFMKDWRDNDKFLDLMYLKTSVLAGISFLFRQLLDFNICVPVPPMLVVYKWSTTLFLRRHSLEDYILKYLNVTLSLKLHPLPRLRPQRFDLRSDLNLNHEASLRPPCFCRKSAEKIRTVVTQWFGFL